MTYGINLNINLSKIDKSKIVEGKQGKYLDLTLFLNPDEEGKYGDHGAITMKQGKDEKDAPKVYVGNAKVFWSDSSPAPQAPAVGGGSDDPFDDDIPW